jgi:hypothetical protein
MEPMRNDTPAVGLDPALMADPHVVLELVGRPRARSGRRSGPARPRPFRSRGPSDPATDPWVDTPGASYAVIGRSWAQRAASVALIVVVGTGLGVAIAGVPH